MEDLILNSYTSRIRLITPAVKTVLVATQTGDTIEDVCRKHGVGNRVFSYSGLVGLILMGELNPNLLVKSIVEKENIDTEKAKLIALDISGAIFQPIKQDLIAMYGLTPKTPPPTSPPATTQNSPAPVQWAAAPSTREAGLSLPEIPTSAPSPTQPVPLSPALSDSKTQKPEDKTFYSPSPAVTPQNDNALSPTGNSKPNIIDLSKEPPRPVAQLGDPPLEGNIVNLKDTNSKPSF